MRFGLERRAVVLLVFAVSTLGVAWAQSPPSENAVSGADCYGCHRIWSPVSMKTMFVLDPQDTQPAAIGGEFELGVAVQQAWVAAPPWPKLTHFAASVDLSNAPSLGFVTQDPPILGVQFKGEIVPGGRPIDVAHGWTSIEIPQGTSEAVFTVATASSDPLLGPDIQLVLHPHRREPGSDPYKNLTIDDTGRGTPERIAISGGENLSVFGSESWVLEVILKPTYDDPSRPIQLEPRTIPFTVTMDAYRNTTGQPVQFVVFDREVLAGGSTIVPFQLRAVQSPGGNESVLVTVQASAYYPHATGGGNDDLGDFSKQITISVVQTGDRIALQQSGPATQAVDIGGTVSLARVSEAIGYLSAFLLISSIASGGMFGSASRRGLNRLFYSAKRRVAFHNSLSYFLILAALLHTILFLIEANYEWTLGIIWGNLAILSMAGLGVTGAWQVGMIRRWSFTSWKWTHYGLAVAAILFTIVHGLLDGANFGAVQEAVGWKNPFPDPRDNAAWISLGGWP